MEEQKIVTVPALHRHVHPYVAWMAVLNFALVAALPGVMFAQETPSTPAPAPNFDVNSCRMKCEESKNACGQSVTTPEAGEQCSRQAEMCYKHCGGFSAEPQHFPGSSGQQPPFGSFGPPSGVPGQQKPEGFQKPQGDGDFRHFPGGFERQQGPGEPGESGGEHQAPQCDLNRIKKQMTRGLLQMSKVKARIVGLEKRGVKIPDELRSATGIIDELTASIKNAESCETLIELEAGEKLQEAGAIIQEQLPLLERLSQLKNIYARIDRKMKQHDRWLIQDKALAKRSKVDLSGPVGEFEATLNSAKEAYAAAKGMMTAGQIEEGFDKLETDVFDQMENLGELHGIVQMIGRLSTGLAQVDRDIKSYQRQLDALKRAKKDVTEAQAILDDGKATLAELKTIAAAKPLDPEAVFDLLKQVEDARGRFLEALNELKGIAEQKEVDQGIQFTPTPDFNFDIGGGSQGGFQGGPGGFR